MPGGDIEQGYIPSKGSFTTKYGSTNLSTHSLPPYYSYQNLSRNSSNSSKFTLSSSSPRLGPLTPRSHLLDRRSSDFSDGSRSSRHRKAPPIHYLPALIAVILFALTIAAWSLSRISCGIPYLCRESFEDVLARNTGTYAPFNEQPWPRLPATCRVDQVTILHRHTARYPTKAAAQRLKTTLGKIAARRVSRPNQREMGFLHNANLDLKGWDMGELTDQGRWDAWESGSKIAKRYPMKLFSRSTDSGRVLETGQYWLQGYHGAEFNGSKSYAPDVIIEEGQNSNNTLSVHSCRGFMSADPPMGSAEKDSLLPLLKPAARRLNGILQPQPSFTPIDVIHIGQMCGFDSAVTHRWSGWSNWCDLLTRSDWEAVGHVADAERWYGVGEGSIYGKTMGAGYVNELLARLFDRAPVDSTTTNHTLDDDPATFPQGGKRLFVDFSHDNEMVEILTAMGFLKMHRKLPTTHVPERKKFILSELVPFGARWAFERVQCGVQRNEATESNDQWNRRNTFVRVLVNDRPMRVDHMACRSSPLTEYGMCQLDAFLESQAWSTEHVKWAKCT